MSLPLLTAKPMAGPVTEKRKARSVSLTPSSVTAKKQKTLLVSTSFLYLPLGPSHWVPVYRQAPVDRRCFVIG